VNSSASRYQRELALSGLVYYNLLIFNVTIRVDYLNMLMRSIIIHDMNQLSTAKGIQVIADLSLETIRDGSTRRRNEALINTKQ